MACQVCKKTYVLSTDDSSFDFDDKPHLCKICGKTFSLKIQLKRHLQSHDNNAPYICSTCEKHPDQSSSYNLRLSKKGNFVCETCNKCFNTKRSLLRHAGEHTMENILNCDECGESFKNITALKRHVILHKPSKSHQTMRNNRKNTSGMSYQCQECGKYFAKLSQYEVHCSNHKKYHCNECNVYFASKKLLQEHLDSGSCQLRYETSLDSSNSNNVSNLHCEGKKHECSICNKSFSRKSAIEGHMMSHFMENQESPVEDDSDKDMDFQCNVKDDKSSELCLPKLKIRRTLDCDKCCLAFSSKTSLNKHMLSHTESTVQIASEYKKTYTCRICQETFDLKESYKQHKLSHEANESNDISQGKEEKSYTCQICLKQFAKKKHLKKHVKAHLDDNSTDDSNFSKNPAEGNSSLNEAMVLTSKKEKRAKNFSCDHCGKLFAGETCWRKHVAKHDNEDKDKDRDDAISRGRKGKKAKPLICEFCNEDFTGKRPIFIKHKLSHTPEVCGICDARFVDRASLREHCRIHIGTEEGRRFLECSQKVLDAKNGVVQQEPKVEYIYLVLR